MNLYLPNYKDKARLAIVVKEEDETIEHEQLVIGEKFAYFKSDNLHIIGEDLTVLKNLCSGDIITISDNGLLYKLFSPKDDDATIYMTGHCNSNCIMCPTSNGERKKSEGMPTEWLLEFIDILPENISHIAVTGGEPTLRLDDFLSVMSVMAKKFTRTETLLLTNGRSFSSTKLVNKLVSACPSYMTVAIPLHGHNSILHDSITRAEGSFVQTVRGIENLLQAGVAVEVRVVVSKLNIRHLTAIAELISKKFSRVRVVNFVGLETRGNCAVNIEQVYVNYSDAFVAMKEAILLLMKNGIDVGIYNFPLCMVNRGYWALCKKSITPEKIRFNNECGKCQVKSICGGFFNTTLSMVKPVVRPILEKV